MAQLPAQLRDLPLEALDGRRDGLVALGRVGSDGAGGASDGSSEATLLFEMIVFDWRPSSSMLRSRSSTNWSVVTFLYASAVFSPREMRPTRYFLVDSASATNVSRSAVTLVSVSASNRFFSPSPTIFVDRS